LIKNQILVEMNCDRSLRRPTAASVIKTATTLGTKSICTTVQQKKPIRDRARRGSEEQRYEGHLQVSTSAVVTAYVVLVTSEFLFAPLRMPAATTIATAEAGAVRFDPCMMWEQIPATVRLSTIVFVASIIVKLGTVGFWICITAVCMMCFHQILQRSH
jgi:hypothetical protein